MPYSQPELLGRMLRYRGSGKRKDVQLVKELDTEMPSSLLEHMAEQEVIVANCTG